MALFRTAGLLRTEALFMAYPAAQGFERQGIGFAGPFGMVALLGDLTGGA